MAIFAGATGVKIPPAGQPVVDPTLFGKDDPSAGTFTKYWYDFLLSLAKAVAPTVSFSAHKNSVDQSITTTAETKLTFGSELWDDGGFFDAANSKWTPPAGLVQINARAFFLVANEVDQVQHYCAVYKNGSLYRLGESIASSGVAAGLSVGVSFTDKANGTDFYEFYVAVLSVVGGARTIFGSPTFTYFQGTAL